MNLVKNINLYYDRRKTNIKPHGEHLYMLLSRKQLLITKEPLVNILCVYFRSDAIQKKLKGYKEIFPWKEDTPKHPATSTDQRINGSTDLPHQVTDIIKTEPIQAGSSIFSLLEMQSQLFSPRSTNSYWVFYSVDKLHLRYYFSTDAAHRAHPWRAARATMYTCSVVDVFETDFVYK